VDEKTIDRLFALAYRYADLFEMYVNRRYPEQKVQDGEVWKQGDPLPEPKTLQEYRDFPVDQPGRFQQAIAAARKHDDSQA